MIANPGHFCQAPNFQSLQLGSPSLNFALTFPNQWGGGGGNPYQDVTRASVVNQTVISEIMIQGDKWIDNLYVTYTSVTGANTIAHGGSGGSAGIPMQLQPGEFISLINGAYGNYINQLTLVTTLQHSVIGPPNPQPSSQGLAWVPPMGSGSLLLGFQGRCDKFLDQLAPVVCTFSPANWN